MVSIPNMNAIRRLLVLVAGLAIVSWGLTQSSDVVIGLPQDTRAVDPHYISDNYENNILIHMFDQLIEREPDGDFRPGVIESWSEIDQDQHVWEFKVREGVIWHDGTPLTAEDVAYSFERIWNTPDTLVDAMISGVENVHIVDEHTLHVTVSVPMYGLLTSLGWMFIVPKHYIEQVGAQEFARRPVGSGPYRFVDWTRDEQLVMEAFPDYWRGEPEIQRIVWRPVPDPATRVAGLLTGELDIIRGISPDDIPRIEANPDVKLLSRTGTRLYFIKMDSVREIGGQLPNSPGVPNGQVNPLLDIRVREALYRAIDIEELIEFGLGGHAVPASQHQAPGVFGFNPGIERLPYDPDHARQLLTDAGYPNGFTIRFDVRGQDSQIGEAIAGYWASVGIDVQLNVMPASVFQTARNEDTSLMLENWGATMVTTSFRSFVHSKVGEYGNYNIGYSHEGIDELIQEAEATFDLAEQEARYQELQHIVMEDLAIIPLYHENILAAARSDLDVTQSIVEHVLAYFSHWLTD